MSIEIHSIDRCPVCPNEGSWIVRYSKKHNNGNVTTFNSHEHGVDELEVMAKLLAFYGGRKKKHIA